MKNLKNNQSGFIEFIVVVIIAIVLLNVIGIDIREVLAKPWVRDFGSYIVDLLRIVWRDILEIFAFIKSLIS